MEIEDLRDFEEALSDKRVKIRVNKFKELKKALGEVELPAELLNFINQQIREINGLENKDEIFKKLGRSQAEILKMLKSETGLIPANYYRNQWLGLGMAVFGIPMGVVFGLSLKNMAFIGLGIPIGLAIGIGIGVGMDAKAKSEGKQLNFES